MPGVHYSKMGGESRRIAELENLVAVLTERLDQLERSRLAQWLSTNVLEAYAGESDAAIALNATGTVSRWGDPWISMSNKYTDTGTNDTVRTIIGPIAANMPVLYLKCAGIEELLAWQSKCAS